MNDVNPTVPVSGEPTVPTVPPVETPPAAPGDKTESALLLKSLQEERDKRRELERLLAEKETAPTSGIAVSDEGRALEKQIADLAANLARRDQQDTLQALTKAHPALKDKAAEFDNFRNLPENTGMRLETAAKAFLIENDLLVTAPPRKGLEPNNGGTRTPPSSDLTADEVADLRANNFREYSKRIRNGTLKLP